MEEYPLILSIKHFNKHTVTTTYTYDDLYRLTGASTTQATSSPYSRTYTYSPIGNITNKSDIGDYTYQGNTGTLYANPHAATGVGSSTYTYDNNGNLTNDGEWIYTWDYKNRLIQVANGIATTTYKYDHTGQRIKQNNGTTETIYPNKYYNIAGSDAKRHIYTNELTATIEADGTSTTTHFIHTDHLTGSSVITNKDGDVEQILDYYPYGSIRLNKKYSSFDEKHKFTGHEYDDDTDLTYAGARYYDQGVGRWLSVDPISQQIPEQYISDPQQFNMYSYARNNPLRFVDPLGLFNVETGEIESGDTLGGITGQLNSTHSQSFTVGQVASANNISNPDKIYAGNFITLPGSNLEARFDNQNLQIFDATYGTGDDNLKWSAVSGKSGVYDSIPEGTWNANPANTQSWSDVSAVRKAASVASGVTQNIPLIGFKMGPWPGGPAAWGDYRTELSNSNGDTGYYIHGGWTAGSAGCIDLTSNNNSFHGWLSGTWGKSLDVIVNY